MLTCGVCAEDNEPSVCPLDGLDGEDVVDKRHVKFGDPIIGTENVTSIDGEPGAREAVPLPSPKEMTAVEWARHCLTHLPYCASCPICAATRRPNDHHRRSHEHERVIPFLVGDYCFVKNSTDDKLLTVIVLKLYPYKLHFACVAPSKGADPYVVARLALFIKQMGLIHFSYRSDREPAVKVLIEEACKLAGRKATPVSTDDLHDNELDVLEHSDVPAVELEHKDTPLTDARVAVPEHSCGRKRLQRTGRTSGTPMGGVC